MEWEGGMIERFWPPGPTKEGVDFGRNWGFSIQIDDLDGGVDGGEVLDLRDGV